MKSDQLATTNMNPIDPGMQAIKQQILSMIPHHAWIPDYPLVAVISPHLDNDVRLKRLLQGGDLTPIFYPSCDAFIRECTIDAIDMLIIDCEAPSNDHIRLLAELREEGKDAPPCVIIHSKDCPDQLAKARLHGANACIKKPFRRKCLLSRLYGLLIRWDEGDSDQNSFGVYHFIPEARGVYFRGKIIKLTPLEYQLALLYFRKAGRVHSREMIMRKYWNQTHRPTSRSVDTLTSRLRGVLELDGRYGWQLQGIYQRGYCLCVNERKSDLAVAEDPAPYHPTKKGDAQRLH